MSVNSSISHPRLTRGSYTSYFTLQISNKHLRASWSKSRFTHWIDRTERDAVASLGGAIVRSEQGFRRKLIPDNVRQRRFMSAKSVCGLSDLSYERLDPRILANAHNVGAQA